MAFFAFMGDSPSPMTDIFSLSFMRTFLETSLPVRAIVTTIGKICLEYSKTTALEKKQKAAASIMAQDRSKLKEFLDVLTSPGGSDQHLMLLYGILLAYAETMTGQSWLFFQATMTKLTGSLQEQVQLWKRTPLLYFDKGLLMNYSLLATCYSLVSFEDTFLVDVELYDPKPFDNIDSITSQVRVNSAILHHYTKFVANFARLHHKATKWVRQARHVLDNRHLAAEPPSHEELRAMLSDAGLLQQGMEIFKSSAAAMDVMENLRGERDEDSDEAHKTDFSTLREAFYHFALMGITRTFWDPTWKLVDEDLPHMADMPHLETHGLFVLERLEQRTPLVGLESWSYLVPLLGVALEARRDDIRQRVDVLMNSIMDKGFAIVGAMLADARMIWEMDYKSIHECIGPVAW
ncbi:hypothetical protein CORC01_04659 [Colletotrichum orchidophilum]|uniref:Uncharacterized protein n=1 Tax=Colletotrichum orchidophilum TaxID=1209926 RepID=A0A1G4BFC1_9PEZI|nr:uncharacterized protein CORC01_04659 [Colletotrichum orchidophilum]OHF00013.1 hypothetical protein CORC01_04659 [Colletotrichum orchidophilum]